jgi:fatty-acyl-CoA synthase
MPLTGVGKIFKPELKRHETVDALRSALHDAGIADPRLEVLDDPRWGTRVEVLVSDSDGIGRARDVLGRFPFRFEVSIAGRPRAS